MKRRKEREGKKEAQLTIHFVTFQTVVKLLRFRCTSRENGVNVLVRVGASFGSENLSSPKSFTIEEERRIR